MTPTDPFTPISYGKSTFAATRDVALYEFRDSIRSRRAIVLLVLYLLGSVTATMLFLKMLGAVVSEIASQTHGLVQGSAVLQNTEVLRDVLPRFIKNHALIDTLLSLPPIAVFFGFFSMTLLPWFIVLSASPRVSEELASGSARFVAFRISRFGWVCGKYLGQALQILFAIALSGVAIAITVMLRMPEFPIGGSVLTMVWIGSKIWIYGLAFLGIALGISQLSAVPMLSTVFGFMAVCGAMLVNLIGNLGSAHFVLKILGALALITPNHYRNNLWPNDVSPSASSLAILIILATAFFLAGYFFFRRRDL